MHLVTPRPLVRMEWDEFGRGRRVSGQIDFIDRFTANLARTRGFLPKQGATLNANSCTVASGRAAHCLMATC